MKPKYSNTHGLTKEKRKKLEFWKTRRTCRLSDRCTSGTKVPDDECMGVAISSGIKLRSGYLTCENIKLSVAPVLVSEECVDMSALHSGNISWSMLESCRTMFSMAAINWQSFR
jgi:hypothetical protein